MGTYAWVRMYSLCKWQALLENLALPIQLREKVLQKFVESEGKEAGEEILKVNQWQLPGTDWMVVLLEALLAAPKWAGQLQRITGNTTINTHQSERACRN